MKWKHHFRSERIKFGFLFFPKRIGNETRWLMFARWKQVYCVDGTGTFGNWWEDSEWVD